MGYVGIPHFDAVTPGFPKEDFVGSDFGTVNSHTNSVQLSVDVPGYNSANCEVVINNVQQEPDTAYTIESDANSLPRVLKLSAAPSSGDVVYVLYKGTGTISVAPPAGSIGATQLSDNLKSFTVDSFTGDGSTTGFTLTETPPNANSVFVSIDGVVQKPTTNYSISGTTITFTSAPASSAEIECRHLGIRTYVRRGPDYQLDTLTGDGSTTGFTISNSVSTNNAFVFINGVQQIPTTAYSISGTTLTFTAAPSSGDSITVRYQL